MPGLLFLSYNFTISQIFDIAEHIKIGSDYKMFEHISDNITKMPLRYSVLKKSGQRYLPT